MNAWEFEEAVWNLEGIRIVVRAPYGEQVSNYDYERADRGNRTLSIFIATRIKPCVGDHDVMAINGSGQVVHGGTHLETIRRSYTD